jgi:hypothetical protein
MRLAEICLMASVLVVVAVVAKMLRAIRMLDGRMTLLQEQLNLGRDALPEGNENKRQKSNKTPVVGVPLTPAPSVPRHTPPVDEPEDTSYLPGEAPIVIDQAEADAVWAKNDAEQNRLKKAMGRDFHIRTPKPSPYEIRGTPISGTSIRSLSSQELARKLERK